MQRIESGRLRGRRLKSLPRGVAGLRPTSARVRGAIFDRLGPAVDGARVLDLFAGSGALTFEALSRGAQQGTLIERDRRVVRFLVEQARDLAVDDRVQVRCADALAWLSGSPPTTPYDLVLIDPPFSTPRVIEPAVHHLVRGWLADHAVVVCEWERIRGKSLDVTWPLELAVQTTRVYGQAEVAFLQYTRPTEPA